MKVYLDDDLDSNRLIGLLRRSGHTPVSPRIAGTRGTSDEQHLIYAAANNLVILTANAIDFVNIHNRWAQEGRDHAGILVVYRENNPIRDMSFAEIADAVKHIEQSGTALSNKIQNLNFWR